MRKTVFTAVALLTLANPLAAQQKGQMSHGKMFLHQMDGDKNGSVSLEEFLKPQQVQFKHMDKDGNGAISEAEADAFAKAIQQRMQQMRQQQGQRK